MVAILDEDAYAVSVTKEPEKKTANSAGFSAARTALERLE